MVWLLSLPTLLIGQDNNFWVQVEAHPNQAASIDAARTYSNLIPDVNAYEIGAGWFVISIGPFDEAEAQKRLFALRSTGVIPLDSFLSRGSNHQNKIWPNVSTKKNTLRTLAPVAVEPLLSVKPCTKPIAETVSLNVNWTSHAGAMSSTLEKSPNL